VTIDSTGRDAPSHSLARQAARWGVVLSNEIIETRSGVLAFGTRQDCPVVLKVPRNGTDEAMAASALQHFGSQAAVRLIERADNGAMLLERAVPGTHLTELVLEGSDERATAILSDLMAAIHKAPPPSGFPSVEDWGEGFHRYAASGDRTLATSMVLRAQELFGSLCRSQGPRCLLHGDLHHDNVVWDTRRDWLVIDPKGVVGEPAYEIGAALRNPTDEPHWFADRTIVEKRVAIFARRLNLDSQRLVAWAYAQAVLSAIWSVEDGEDPEKGLATAAALKAMLE
jgi:streptomycin 6-kinase